jgi:hypothetical protein
VENNVADDGGGIDHLGGNLTVERSSISNNTANGLLDLNGDGGAIQNGGTLLTITNSTISKNNGVASGGAIDDDVAATTITDSTIANNTAGADAGGAIADTDANETFKNTIVAKNTDSVAGTASDNCQGPGTSQGNNLEDLNTCGFNQTTDMIDIADPKLGLLANNGGPTDTVALLATSPAIDSGNSDAATDQRGVSRPLDGDINGSAIDDRGAFEKEGAACSDGKDNDRDRKIDFPKDKGCKSTADNNEKNKKHKKHKHKKK